MRELVYLSEAKLLQFAGTRKQRGRNLEGELKTPLGGFKIGRAADGAQASVPNLDAVIAELEASPRAPKWFEDDSVQPGQWVHFESKLNYSVMPEESFSSAVLFLNSPAGERLLLHGSSTHLVGQRPRATKVDLDGEDVQQGSSYASAGGWVHHAYSDEQRANLRGGARVLGAETDESLDPYEEAVHLILAKLGRWSPATSAWMAGYARVTGALPAAGTHSRMVVATPLYVEYVDPPQD